MKKVLFLILFFAICFSVSAANFSLGAGIYYHAFEISNSIIGLGEIFLNFRANINADLFFKISKTISIGPGVQLGYVTSNVNDADFHRLDFSARMLLKADFVVISVYPHLGMSGIYFSDTGYSGAGSELQLFLEAGSRLMFQHFFSDLSFLLGLNGESHLKVGVGYQFDF